VGVKVELGVGWFEVDWRDAVAIVCVCELCVCVCGKCRFACVYVWNSKFGSGWNSKVELVVVEKISK
jgi:hypothetical protein